MRQDEYLFLSKSVKVLKLDLNNFKILHIKHYKQTKNCKNLPQGGQVATPPVVSFYTWYKSTFLIVSPGQTWYKGCVCVCYQYSKYENYQIIM